MRGFKQFASVMVAAVALAGIPALPAVAGPLGYGHFHAWGPGRGLVGAVVGLATLPIAIAAATIGAVASVPYAAGYQGGPAYAPPPAYYATPAPYYAPPSYPRPRSITPRLGRTTGRPVTIAPVTITRTAEFRTVRTATATHIDKK